MLRKTLILAVCALVLAFSLRSSAQTGVSTGTILGTVTDSTGAVLPKSQVVATNVQTHYTRTVTTEGDGTYIIPLLPPGDYAVTVSQPGFSTVVSRGLSLAVDRQNLRADVSLKVGQTTQSVEVSATPLQVDTHSAEVGAIAGPTQIQQLPLQGNSFLQVVNIMPGILPIGQTQGPNVNPLYNFLGTEAQALGSRYTNTDYQIDSSEFRLNYYGGAPNMPTSKTIQEVKVITDNFNAEYGISSAAVINAVTKSGTNRLHGSGYETLGNDILNSRSFTAGPIKAPLRYNQFGGDVGGPVLLPHLYNGVNKTFFYFNYEGIRKPSASTLSGAIVPTAAMKNGDFSALSTPIIDPNTGQPFQGNMIPVNREDPVAKYLLNAMPAANFGNQWRQNYATPSAENQYTIKVDEQIGSKSHLFGRWFSDTPTSAETSGTVIVFPANQATRSIVNKSLTLNHTYTFSPTVLNQTSFSWTRIIQQEVPGSGFSSSLLNSSGVGFVNWDTDNGPILPPNFQVPGYDISIQTFSGLVYRENAYLGNSTTTWVHHRHTAKFGVEYGRYTIFSSNGPNGNGRGQGSFDFNGAFTGNGLADLFIGKSDTMGRASALPTDLVGHTFAVFAQDDYKVSRRLTLNLGVRWGFMDPYASTQGYGGVWNPGHQSTVIPNAPLGLNYPGDPGVPKGLYNTDWRNWSPRFGFAFDPTGSGKTSIRGGYGIYYNLVDYSQILGAMSVQPYGLNVTETPYSLSNPFNGLSNPFPYVFNPSAATFSLPVGLSSAMSPNYTFGYSEEWSLGVQHQVGTVLFEARYKGNEGHKLSGAYQDNPAVYIPGTDALGNPLSTLANTDSRRIYLPGTFSSVTTMADYSNSNYQAMEFSARGRVTRSLLATFAWTWGHSLDDSSITGAGYTSATSNPFDRHNDKGNSNFDFRHVVTASVVYNAPKFSSLPAVARAVVGGWAWSTIFKAQTGGWATMLAGEDISFSGVGNDRAQVLLPRSQWLNSAATTRGEQFADYVNKAAFGLPPVGTFGNSGRNDLESPGRQVFDMSLQKYFPIYEKANIRFRTDAYNVFNHTRLADCYADWSCDINQSVISPTFGAITATQSGRTFQFGVDVVF